MVTGPFVDLPLSCGIGCHIVFAAVRLLMSLNLELRLTYLNSTLELVSDLQCAKTIQLPNVYLWPIALLGRTLDFGAL